MKFCPRLFLSLVRPPRFVCEWENDISNVQCQTNSRSIFQVHLGHSLLEILRRERASALSLADASPFFFYRSSAVEEGEESKKGSPARMHACMWDHVCVRNTRTYTKMSNRLGLADGTVAETPTRFPASTRCRPKIFTHDKGQETGKSATILFSRFFPLALSFSPFSPWQNS